MTPLPIPEKPEGFQEHHRQKRRSKDERPVNKLWVTPDLHVWIEAHPAEAAQLGWTVSQNVDPAEVVVTIPAAVMKSLERKPRGPRREKARDRKTITFKVPKDKVEDGAGLFDDLWVQAEEKLERDTEEGVTIEGLTGQYGVLLAILYFFVVNYQPEQEES